MSGGHFNYDQYRIHNIVTEIEDIIANNDRYDFTLETILKFKEAVLFLKHAEIMANRIDWLVSDDDGEETFHKRWEEELGKL